MYMYLQDMLWESSSEDGESGEEEGGGENEGREGKSGKGAGGVVDVEDIGRVLHKVKVPRVGREGEVRGRVEHREMVTPMLRKNLTKQGVYASSC